MFWEKFCKNHTEKPGLLHLRERKGATAPESFILRLNTDAFAV